MHDTTVPLERWPESVDSASVPKAGLRYDPRKSEFGVTGALSQEIARQLLALTDDEPFRHAVRELYEASHIVAVSDEYGYNPAEEAGTPNPVRDLMVSMRIVPEGGAGEFVIEMTNGATVFAVVFDVIRREVQLFAEPLPEGTTLNSQPIGFVPKSEPVASAPWPKSLSTDGGKVEVSLFDKQVLVAIDGKTYDYGSVAVRIAFRKSTSTNSHSFWSPRLEHQGQPIEIIPRRLLYRFARPPCGQSSLRTERQRVLRTG